jgi:hypothetical protein
MYAFIIGDLASVLPNYTTTVAAIGSLVVDTTVRENETRKEEILYHFKE